MNSVEDDDFSHWDSLADELGIAPPPAEKKAPEPAKPALPPPLAHPEPAHSEGIEAAEEPEPEQEVEDYAPEQDEEEAVSTGQDSHRAESADTVLDEEESLESAPTELETAEEAEEKEEGKGRRRRRRRRKKKGGNVDAPQAEAPIEPEGIKPPAAAAKPKPPVRSIEALEETSVEFLDEAPEELEDDDDQKSEVTSAMDEELMEETAQPGPEWKVVSWTELVGSLYRPER